MTISDDLYFVYDGIRSTDMGILNVSRDSGMFEELFLPQRQINKIIVRGRSRPYFQDITYEPLQIPLRFAFKNKWNEELIRDVARWLMQDYYKELYFSNNINRRFYAIYNDDPRIIHNGLRQGYVDIVMENIDAYTYSPIYETEIYDYTLNTANGTELLLINYGDTICLPTIYVQIISGNSFSIINYSNGGQELKFNDLVVNEELTIDCENEEIETDLPLTYRYDNHNGVFLELVRGNNYLKVFGNIKLKFKMQFKTFQG